MSHPLDSTTSAGREIRESITDFGPTEGDGKESAPIRHPANPVRQRKMPTLYPVCR